MTRHGDIVQQVYQTLPLRHEAFSDADSLPLTEFKVWQTSRNGLRIAAWNSINPYSSLVHDVRARARRGKWWYLQSGDEE